MERFDVAVVGAGISGLSLAYHCARAGRRTCLLERSGRVGGALHSERPESGFWLELGAHTCYNSYGNLLAILDACGLLPRLIAREKVPWKIWEDGRLESVLSRVHFPELLFSLPRLFWTGKAGHSVESYYARILGARNYRETVGPMLSAVASQDAGPFPAGMLFKKRPRRKEILRSFTLPGGVQTVADAIADSGAFTLRSDADVKDAARIDGGYRLTGADGTEYEAAALALATPAATSASLLREIHPRLADLLLQVRVHAVPTVGVVVRQADVALDRVAGIVATDDRFYSVVSRDTVPHEEYRGFAFHFRPGTEEAVRMERISAVLGLDSSRWMHVANKINVLPAPVVGHDRLVAEIDRELQGQPLLLTGNYFGGLAIEDCVTRSVAEAARLGSEA